MRTQERIGDWKTPAGNRAEAASGRADADADLPALVEELDPTLDPWDAFCRLSCLPHVLFLDSAPAASQPPLAELARYSFVTADPFAYIEARGQCVWVSGEPRARAADPFAVLADCLARYRRPTLPGLPPFQGGAAGMLGYDLCHHVERLPRPRFDEFRTPDLAVGLYDWVVAFDHAAGRAWLIFTGLPARRPYRRLARAQSRLRQVKRRLYGVTAGRAIQSRLPLAPARGCDRPPPTLSRSYPVPGIAGLRSNFNRAGFLDAVRRAVEYTHAGDCFQVNIAQRLLYPAPAYPGELYRRLRLRSAAPFAGYFDLGDFVVASASPERFLSLRDGVVEARPIKGTRPRGQTASEDKACAAELLASAKDRAENVMIVDLLRNDLGRVCRYASIDVPAVCRLESYRHVHHLVSEVRGRLRPGARSVDLLRAAFPGGSVTGAPKVRAMEIIAELEPTARGPYCGSLGYLGFDGSMDLSILIRTLTIGHGWVQFPVGGGIVADSHPECEYEETWHKARGLIEAVTGTP